MSVIYNLLDKDIYLSYSWDQFKDSNHGICGHTFEVIDYFWILKDYFNVGIFIADTSITQEIFLRAITSKYDFNKTEIEFILKNTKFVKNKPKLIQANNIIFTDGGMPQLKKITILANNVILFACGYKEIKNNNKKNWWILQDNRVYEPVLLNGIHYIKKILFDRLKKIETTSNDSLLYLTENCRTINKELLYNLINRDETFLIISNESYNFKNNTNIIHLKPPVENIFMKFNKYIYTPVLRKWDCSPRFLAECKYYNKIIEYFNIDYYDIDLGLYYRKQDIEKNFNSLFLNKNDSIIVILNNIIKGNNGKTN